MSEEIKDRAIELARIGKRIEELANFLQHDEYVSDRKRIIASLEEANARLAILIKQLAALNY